MKARIKNMSKLFFCIFAIFFCSVALSKDLRDFGGNWACLELVEQDAPTRYYPSLWLRTNVVHSPNLMSQYEYYKSYQLVKDGSGALTGENILSTGMFSEPGLISSSFNELYIFYKSKKFTYCINWRFLWKAYFVGIYISPSNSENYFFKPVFHDRQRGGEKSIKFSFLGNDDFLLEENYFYEFGGNLARLFRKCGAIKNESVFNDIAPVSLFLQSVKPCLLPFNMSDVLNSFGGKISDVKNLKDEVLKDRYSKIKEYLGFLEKLSGEWDYFDNHNPKFNTKAESFLSRNGDFYFIFSPSDERNADNFLETLDMYRISLRNFTSKDGFTMYFERLKINVFLKDEKYHHARECSMALKNPFFDTAKGGIKDLFVGQNFKWEISDDFTEIKEYVKNGENWVLQSVMKKVEPKDGGENL